MAKFKAAGSKKGSSKSSPASKAGIIPCAFLLLLIFGAVFALFFFSLK